MHFTGRAGCVSCSDLCHFLLISAGNLCISGLRSSGIAFPAYIFLSTLSQKAELLPYSTAFFQKLQQLRQGFRMGQIPPKVCRQKPDRHDHKGSDKYCGKSADTAVQPDAADTAYQRGTGINMLYEDVGFLPCHHVTHQTTAYTGKHSYKHQQEGISFCTHTASWLCPPSFVSFANDTGRERKKQDGILAKKHERRLPLLCNAAKNRRRFAPRPRIDGVRKS